MSNKAGHITVFPRGLARQAEWARQCKEQARDPRPPTEEEQREARRRIAEQQAKDEGKGGGLF